MRPAPCTKLCTATGHVDAGYNRLGVINPCSATSRLVSDHPCNVPWRDLNSHLPQTGALPLSYRDSPYRSTTRIEYRDGLGGGHMPNVSQTVHSHTKGGTPPLRRTMIPAQVHPRIGDAAEDDCETMTSQPLPHVVHQGGHPLNILGCPPPQPPNTNNSNCPLGHHVLCPRPVPGLATRASYLSAAFFRANTSVDCAYCHCRLGSFRARTIPSFRQR